MEGGEKRNSYIIEQGGSKKLKKGFILVDGSFKKSNKLKDMASTLCASISSSADYNLREYQDSEKSDLSENKK